MNLDDNNSDLEELKIDRQLAALLRRHSDRLGPIRIDSRENGKSARRIAEALVIAALLGLGSSLWLLKGTVEVQQASIQFLQKQVDVVSGESRENTKNVAEMQGRFYRDLQQGRDPNAPH